MKKVFQFLSLFVFGATFLTFMHSCKQDTEETQAAHNSASEMYIRQHYSDYQQSRVLETEVEGIPYLIEEFLVNGGKIKAYTVTDKRLGRWAYFVEQNGERIYAYDFITGESFTGTLSAKSRAVPGQNISTDLLSLVENGGGETAGRKFWGWDKVDCWVSGDGICSCKECYYVFGIRLYCRPYEVPC